MTRNALEPLKNVATPAPFEKCSARVAMGTSRREEGTSSHAMGISGREVPSSWLAMGTSRPEVCPSSDAMRISSPEVPSSWLAMRTSRPEVRTSSHAMPSSFSVTCQAPHEDNPPFAA